MKCRIVKMRRAGDDVPKHELKGRVFWSGDLVILGIRDDGLNRYVRVAKHARQFGDSKVVDVLYEPHIIWMNEDRFTLAGFERVLNGEKIVQYAQSWLCEVDNNEAAQ